MEMVRARRLCGEERRAVVRWLQRVVFPDPCMPERPRKKGGFGDSNVWFRPLCIPSRGVRKEAIRGVLSWMIGRGGGVASMVLGWYR